MSGAETEGDMLNVKRKIINCTELERHLNPMEEARKEHDAVVQKFEDFNAVAKTYRANQQTMHEITEKVQELQNQIEDKDREIEAGQQKYKECATRRTDRITILNTKKAEKVRAQVEQKATNASLKTAEEQLRHTEKEHTTAQVCARVGLEVHTHLSNRKPQGMGNYPLDRLLENPPFLATGLQACLDH